MFLFHSIQYHILIVLPISRHEARQIYTYIGDVCVSVNPYTELSIYDQATVNQYKGGDNANGGFFQRVWREILEKFSPLLQGS